MLIKKVMSPYKVKLVGAFFYFFASLVFAGESGSDFKISLDTTIDSTQIHDGDVELSSLTSASRTPDTPVLKISPSHYFFSSGISANDLNIRLSTQTANVWVGYYGESDSLMNQYRLGFDNRIPLTSDLFFLPSLQTASGGFWGGSAGIEYDINSWFIGSGLGRTNLVPNSNLNFDPGEAYSLQFGKNISDSDNISLLHVHDNRNNPDQSNTHFLWKSRLQNSDHLSIDILYKHGLVNEQMINRWGTALEYDRWHYFLRLAYDPNVNFTNDNMIRVTLGLRF